MIASSSITLPAKRRSDLNRRSPARLPGVLTPPLRLGWQLRVILARLTPILFVLLASAQDTGSLPLTELEQMTLRAFIAEIQMKNREISDMTKKIQELAGEAHALAAQRMVFENDILRKRNLPTDQYFVSESTRTIERVNPPTPRPVGP